MSTLSELLNRVRRASSKTMGEETPKQRYSHIPDANVSIALNCSRRAEAYRVKYLQPTLELIEELEACVVQGFEMRKVGHQDARLVIQEANQAIKEAKNVPGYQEHWAEYMLLRQDYVAEGLTEAESKQAWGAACGRFFQNMEGVKVDKKTGYVISKSITLVHYELACEMIEAEMHNQEHVGGEGGDTCADFILNKPEDETREKALSEESKDIIAAQCTNELEKIEFVKIDALKEKLAKLAQAGAA